MKYEVKAPNGFTCIEGLLNYARDLYRGILITVSPIGMAHQPKSEESLSYGPAIAMALLVDTLELPEQVAEDFLEGRINFEMDVQVVYRGGPDNQTRIDEATIILSPPVTWPKFEVPVAIFDTERQQPGNFSFDHGYCGLVLEETDGEHGFVAQNDEVAFFFSLDGDKPVHMEFGGCFAVPSLEVIRNNGRPTT
tara:strand:- start:74 stop:655 length:582 start_codon:yes stop_codon:yes gene_type:complete